VFKKGELEELIKASGNLTIVDSYYDHANWCVVCEKIWIRGTNYILWWVLSYILGNW